jgi:nitrous oxidase accessory protein
MKRLFAAAALLLGALALPAEGRTWRVGGRDADFPLITPALAAAADGDTVIVRAGVYREDLKLVRRVALVGEGRPVLIGTGEGTVLEIAAPGCEVRGFDIEGSGLGLTNRMDAAVRVTAGGGRVAGNRMRRIFYGVVVEGVSGVTIADNEIVGFSELPFGRRGDGIYLYRAPGNEIRGNRIAGMRDAIYLQYSPRCRAIGNTAASSRYGLHDMFSDDAEISANTFRDCSAGANIMNCRRITLAGNRFERNRGVSSVGLALKECDASAVSDSDIVDNARGLQIEGSSGNRFAGNRFRYNDTALLLFSSAENNTFTENDFRDNLSGLVVSGNASSNRFAESGRGNRWDGYRGFDFDGDGVGDSPHPLLGAFEKLEGNNPAIRLFLQSPAAGALELAARAIPPARDDATDPSPLTGRSAAANGRPARDNGRAWTGLFAGSVLSLLAGLALAGVRPC